MKRTANRFFFWEKRGRYYGRWITARLSFFFLWITSTAKKLPFYASVKSSRASCWRSRRRPRSMHACADPWRSCLAAARVPSPQFARAIYYGNLSRRADDDDDGGERQCNDFREKTKREREHPEQRNETSVTRARIDTTRTVRPPRPSRRFRDSDGVWLIDCRHLADTCRPAAFFKVVNQ